MAKHLYETLGFRVVLPIDFNTKNTAAGDIWRKCEYELKLMPIFAMWMPFTRRWNEIDNENMPEILRELRIDPQEPGINAL